jgi:hypothetical protein
VTKKSPRNPRHREVTSCVPDACPSIIKQGCLIDYQVPVATLVELSVFDLFEIQYIS